LVKKDAPVLEAVSHTDKVMQGFRPPSMDEGRDHVTVVDIMPAGQPCQVTVMKPCEVLMPSSGENFSSLLASALDSSETTSSSTKRKADEIENGNSRSSVC
jgi:hypothetical protein